MGTGKAIISIDTGNSFKAVELRAIYKECCFLYTKVIVMANIIQNEFGKIISTVKGYNPLWQITKKF